MSNYFENLTEEGIERTEDRVGGFQLFESDIYPAKIKAAIFGTSDAGALYVEFLMDIKGKDYRERFYVTNRNKENFYKNKDGRKCFLPNFNIVNNICLLAIRKSLAKCGENTEEKVLEIYDPEQGKPVKKSVPVLTDLSGEEVLVGILREIHNKSKKAGDSYIDTPEIREINTINAVFDVASHKTRNELEDDKEADFYDKWLEANKGKTRDRRTIKDDSSSSGSNTSEAKPKKSLFDR